jgi:hypothetical protein
MSPDMRNFSDLHTFPSLPYMLFSVLHRVRKTRSASLTESADDFSTSVATPAVSGTMRADEDMRLLIGGLD